jgi:methyltransferase (TIGR00027 family)
MDTFAFRCPEMVEELEVFEVDHPATQEFKRKRIAQLGWKQPTRLHYIPVDFTHDSLESILTRTPSFDPKAKSFFSWLGGTMYLTREEVFATLSSISNVGSSGSMLVFDYFEAAEFSSDNVDAYTQPRQEMLRSANEPMKTGFEPQKLALEISPLGFRLHEDLSPDKIEKRYFQRRTDGYHAHDRVHFACAIIE